MCVSICVNAHVSGQEVVVAGLRSVVGKNGNYAAAETTAGHSTSFGFPDTLQPQTTSHHYPFNPSIPGECALLILLQQFSVALFLPFLCSFTSPHSPFHPCHIPTLSFFQWNYTKCFLTKCCPTLLFKH